MSSTVALSPILKPISALKADPQNARRHDNRNLEALKQSLLRFGQVKPVVALVDGTVIAGNGTMAAAQDLGWTELAVVTFTDPKLARAYAIADNRTAELATWDAQVLADALRSFEADGVELAAVGFSAEESAAIIATAFAEQPDDPEPPVQPIEQPDATGDETGLPTGQVRVVQLHLTPDQHTAFKKAIRKLARDGHKDVTAAVMSALKLATR